jgi:hypothetical protein
MAGSMETRRFASLLLWYLVAPWLGFIALMTRSNATLVVAFFVVITAQMLITVMWPPAKDEPMPDLGRALERLARSRNLDAVEERPATLAQALGTPLTDDELASLVESTSTPVA